MGVEGAVGAACDAVGGAPQMLVQRALDGDGHQLSLLEGDTLLQHRLNSAARTTKDVDGARSSRTAQFMD